MAKRIGGYTPKKLRQIRVEYTLKNQANKYPFKLDFNEPQFDSIDDCIELIKENMKVSATKAVLVRAAVAEYSSWIKSILKSNNKQDKDILLRQLESASQDR